MVPKVLLILYLSISRTVGTWVLSLTAKVPGEAEIVRVPLTSKPIDEFIL